MTYQSTQTAMTYRDRLSSSVLFHKASRQLCILCNPLSWFPLFSSTKQSINVLIPIVKVPQQHLEAKLQVRKYRSPRKCNARNEHEHSTPKPHYSKETLNLWMLPKKKVILPYLPSALPPIFYCTENTGHCSERYGPEGRSLVVAVVEIFALPVWLLK